MVKNNMPKKKMDMFCRDRRCNLIPNIKILISNQILDLSPLIPSELIENYLYLKNNVGTLSTQLELYLAKHTHQII